MSSSKKKNIWLEAGLAILTQEDASKLTIENLVAKTGKTKGSFYHHFSSHDNFAKELMAYWMNTYTTVILDKSRLGATPNDKLRTLILSTLKIPRKTELAIRAWALRSPVVKEFQDRIDRTRLKYLEEIFYSVSGDKKSASIKAFKMYTAFIGYQQLAHLIVGNKSPYISELFEVANYELRTTV